MAMLCRWVIPGESQDAHGRDEGIGVAAFDEEPEFTYRLMKEVSAR
jgi:hypothetical protein